MYQEKKELVKELAKAYKKYFSKIASIELKKYKKITSGEEEEFILLTWNNGAISTANNNMNSLAATGSNVARMLNGGVYENLSYYKEIMESEEWEEM